MLIQKKGTAGVNFQAGRDGQTAVAIVDHIMGRAGNGDRATMGGTWSWFSSAKSEVSAHFGVSKKGEVWQFVDPRNTAWANGILENPDLTIPWLKSAVENKVNPNELTISIEHEGDSADLMPPEQYAATLELHRFLIEQYKIVPDRKHIIGHYQITGRQRANCPGSGFPWEKLMSDLNNILVIGNYTDPITKVVIDPFFLKFYLAHGGVEIFGRPILPAAPGGPAAPGVELFQWFERARFERHGETIMLGLVGNEAKEVNKIAWRA